MIMIMIMIMKKYSAKAHRDTTRASEEENFGGK